MDEILDGVFHWKAMHPNIRTEVDCHFVAGSGTAIDPLLPDEGIEWFEQRGVERIVLSNRHHRRHAPEIAERFGCPILCHESGFGDRLAEDVVALEMDAICPDDTVLLIEAGGGALLSADSLIHRGTVGFVSDRLIGDNAEDVKRRIRERCDALLDQRFEHLLFAHGDPLLGEGREALRTVAKNR
jgi:hypothetical protein